MVDIDYYIKGLKSSWIKRIVNGKKAKWIQLLEHQINPDKTLYLGSDYLNTLLKELKNPFWKDILIAFQNIQEKTEITTWNVFMNQPIWYNKYIKIGKKALFYEQCFMKNVLLISDILYENGIIYRSAELKNKIWPKN